MADKITKTPATAPGVTRSPSTSPWAPEPTATPAAPTTKTTTTKTPRAPRTPETPTAPTAPTDLTDPANLPAEAKTWGEPRTSLKGVKNTDPTQNPISTTDTGSNTQLSGKGIRVSPDLPFIPGNSASFFAAGAKKGTVTAKIEKDGVEDDWHGPVSSTDDESGITILFERPGKFKVSFLENNKVFASASYEVAAMVDPRATPEVTPTQAVATTRRERVVTGDLPVSGTTREGDRSLRGLQSDEG